MDPDNDYIVQYSDEEGGMDSSDDDELVMERFLKRKVLSSTDQADTSTSSIKEFEAEMKQEMELRAKTHQAQEGFSLPKHLGAEAKTDEKKYFDTDSEEEGSEEDTEARTKEQEDLFYDPEMDSKDEAWVTRQRGKYQSPVKKNKPAPKSDAVLNCPACFTTLCHDCQRHETYKTQYRAMFTFNCKVDKSQIMKAPQPKKKGRPKEEGIIAGASGSLTDETYHPVRCSACETHVAMFDKDEIFHFFNVVTSH